MIMVAERFAGSIRSMDIGNIGTGGIDRSAARPDGPVLQPQPQPRPVHGPIVSDHAAISDASRATMAAIDRFSDQARAGEDRSSLLEAVRARLRAGALDAPEVWREAARALLGDV